LRGGFTGLAAVAANRVPLAYDRMVHQWWLLFPGTGVAIAGIAVVWTSRSRRERALVVALLGGLAASLVVNDSPGPVVIGGLAGLLALEGGAVQHAITLPVLRRL